MATYTKTKSAGFTLHKWAGATTANSASDTAADITLDTKAVSISVSGTFGGASVAVHGSFDGTNFAPLRDKFGAAVAITGAAVVELASDVRYVKPVITAGVGDSLEILLGVHTA